MSQSNLIFGILLFAFIVYITSRGQLPDYISLFTSKGSGEHTTASKSTSTGSKSKGVDWGRVFGFIQNIQVE